MKKKKQIRPKKRPTLLIEGWLIEYNRVYAGENVITFKPGSLDGQKDRKFLPLYKWSETPRLTEKEIYDRIGIMELKVLKKGIKFIYRNPISIPNPDVAGGMGYLDGLKIPSIGIRIGLKEVEGSSKFQIVKKAEIAEIVLVDTSETDLWRTDGVRLTRITKVHLINT